MTDMREKVARAIFERHGYCVERDGDPFNRMTWEEATSDDYQPEAGFARDLAQAAITALWPLAMEEAAKVAFYWVDDDIEGKRLADLIRNRKAPV
jgi:hypothetical protein